MADESSFKENNEEKMQSVNPRKKKICQICGDFSLGFNFGAVSCESCKAFFRRNAAKMKVFRGTIHIQMCIYTGFNISESSLCIF